MELLKLLLKILKTQEDLSNIQISKKKFFRDHLISILIFKLKNMKDKISKL
jgi:hypothetical protein